MRRFLPAAVGCALAAAMPSHAATTWLCSVSEELDHLVCLADTDPIEPVEDAVPVRAVVRGTRFPLQPEQMYVVPLWTPPSDLQFVEQLAQATICFRTPGCKAVVSPGEWSSLQMTRGGAARVAKR